MLSRCKVLGFNQTGILNRVRARVIRGYVSIIRKYDEIVMLYCADGQMDNADWRKCFETRYLGNYLPVVRSTCSWFGTRTYVPGAGV
jgi:hypothetical protein